MLDMNFGRSAKNTGQEGFDWLARILEIDPGAVVILITAYGDVELANQVEAVLQDVVSALDGSVPGMIVNSREVV